MLLSIKMLQPLKFKLTFLNYYVTGVRGQIFFSLRKQTHPWAQVIPVGTSFSVSEDSSHSWAYEGLWLDTALLFLFRRFLGVGRKINMITNTYYLF